MMRFVGGLRGSLFILAIIFTVLLGMMELWANGPIPWAFVLVALGAGFVFALVQGHRGKNTYGSRLMSSAISLSLAVCFIAQTAYYLTAISLAMSPLAIVCVLIAYRVVATDLRMWRWFEERHGDSSSA